MLIFVFLMTLHFKTWHEKHDYYMNFQPLELFNRTRARKTDEVTKKTVRQLSKTIAETRTAVSGGAAGTQLVG